MKSLTLIKRAEYVSNDLDKKEEYIWNLISGKFNHSVLIKAMGIFKLGKEVFAAHDYRKCDLIK